MVQHGHKSLYGSVQIVLIAHRVSGIARGFDLAQAVAAGGGLVRRDILGFELRVRGTNGGLLHWWLMRLGRKKLLVHLTGKIGVGPDSSKCGVTSVEITYLICNAPLLVRFRGYLMRIGLHP